MIGNKKVVSADASRGTPIHLAKNWWILFLSTAFLLGSALFIGWFITYPAIDAAQSGQPLPADWTWTNIILVDCALACVTLIGHWHPWVELRTEFTDEYVSRPSLFGLKIMRWDGITQVLVKMVSGVQIIELWSGNRRIKINPLYYKDSEELIAVIRRYAPTTAFI